MNTRPQDTDETDETMTSSAAAKKTAKQHPAVGVRGPRPISRTTLFTKNTRKNQEFERFLCDGQEAVLLDATTSKYIPLTYFVTPHTAAATAAATATRRTHGVADKMPYESFRLINLQQRGNHAHSLILFKSRAITTNPENIAIFECNGQYTQSEIRVIHTSHPSKEYTDSDSDSDSDEPGTVYDVTEHYFSPISPKICINYGNDKHNPGYCGIFGMIAMIFFRGFRPPTTGGKTTFNYNDDNDDNDAAAAASHRWIRKWTQFLKYMRQEIPDEPSCHGCMGTKLAARVQEIIAAHPSTITGHQSVEKEIKREIKQGG
jgi:hypothetical protein